MGKQNIPRREARATAGGAVAAAGLISRVAGSQRPLKGVLTRKIRESHVRKVALFLSTGNTCRSPMAAGYFKKLLEERKTRNIEVRSAGVMTIAGLLATDESKLMLEPYGVTLDKHRSQPLTEDMIRRADLILGMTPFHVQMALRLSPDSRGKTFLLKEYTQTDPKNRPIPDPMGCTLEVYKKCFRQIKLACDRLIEAPFVTGRPARAARPAAWKAGATAPAPKTKPARMEKGGTGGTGAKGGAGLAAPSGRKASVETASKSSARVLKAKGRS